MNVEQQKEDNRKNLDDLGGIDGLVKLVGVDPLNGWSKDQVNAMRTKYGMNAFPETPLDSYFKLLLEALSDSILLILIAASTVSLIIGVLTHPDNGWIEAVAIFIAIFLVSNISAGREFEKQPHRIPCIHTNFLVIALILTGNDYTKQLQFRALEKSSAADDRSSVLRDGAVERINPKEIVVGDVSPLAHTSG
ncbi:hypothetical protein EON65_28940 [archaeon]|nr:MAG: hypothetical protein EON65_28940 [archaeon]